MTNTIPCCEGDNGGGVEVVNSVGTRRSDSERGGLWKVNSVSFVPLMLAVARVMRAEMYFPQPTEGDTYRERV